MIILITIAAAALAAVLFLFVRCKMYDLIDRRIERFQSELIENQIRETENMYKQVRGWRHDYRNHIQDTKIQLSQRNYDGLDDYLSQLADDLNTVDTVIKTGNVMADAILNSKLSTAQGFNISLNVKANIPEKLVLSDVELCAVMGNLLDNTIEACGTLPEEKRFIRIYIGQLKGQFYLSIQNSAGKVNKRGSSYLSTKSGEHGYGLFRIDRISKKYGGYINRQNEDGIFATELMLPLPQ